MDEHMLMKLCQMNAAIIRMEAMKAEMMAAAARGDSVTDYSRDMRWEADLIDQLWRG